MGSPTSVEQEMDRINRRAYGHPRVVQEFGQASGWLDPGEKAAVVRALAAGASGPLLDIGIGGGRTVPLMRAISQAYTGIDYLPEMIQRASRNFPDADLRVMDARQMALEDAGLGLVTFSFNGIDSVAEEGRARILREVHRVLRPGGFFVFSALNHHGTFDRALFEWPGREEFRHPRRLLRWPLRMVLGWMNVRRNAHVAHDGEERSRRAVKAHHYGLVAQYTSVAEQHRELERNGFVVEACYDCLEGRVVEPQASLPDVAYLHYVARKPA